MVESAPPPAINVQPPVDASLTQSSVTVSVRIRPFLQREQGQRAVVKILNHDEEKGQLPTIALDVMTSQLSCKLLY